MAVHNELGHGFLEAVYCEALHREFLDRGIPCEKEVGLPVLYKGWPLSTSYRVDFICFSQVIVEVKALQRLSEIETAQVINYLKASGMKTALLINFGAPSLGHRRFVL